MTKNPHFKLTTRNAMLNVITASIGTTANFIIYAGGQPADVSSATTAANTTVAALSWTTSVSCFLAATLSAITANAITSDTSAAGGTAAWFSITMSTGTRVADGSVGTDASTFDLALNSVTISTGATVAITAFSITQAA